MKTRVHRGDVAQHLPIRGLLPVQGAGQADAAVEEAAALRVVGVVHGVLTTAPGASVIIEVTLAAEVDNDGYLMVAGRLDGPIRHDSGVIGVAEGSLVRGADGEFARLDPDSAVRAVHDAPCEPTPGRRFLRRRGDGRYRPFDPTQLDQDD